MKRMVSGLLLALLVAAPYMAAESTCVSAINHMETMVAGALADLEKNINNDALVVQLENQINSLETDVAPKGYKSPRAAEFRNRFEKVIDIRREEASARLAIALADLHNQAVKDAQIAAAAQKKADADRAAALRTAAQKRAEEEARIAAQKKAAAEAAAKTAAASKVVKPVAKKKSSVGKIVAGILGSVVGLGVLVAGLHKYDKLPNAVSSKITAGVAKLKGLWS